MTTPKLPPADLHGHASVTGTDTTYWGPPRLTLYGTAEEPQLYAERPMAGQASLKPRPEDLIRFAREVLAFLGEDYGVELPPWRPANNGTGKRIWFLVRGDGDPRVPLKDRYHFGAGGNLVRYASVDSAQRAADKLNAARKEATA